MDHDRLTWRIRVEMWRRPCSLTSRSVALAMAKSSLVYPLGTTLQDAVVVGIAMVWMTGLFWEFTWSTQLANDYVRLVAYV